MIKVSASSVKAFMVILALTFFLSSSIIPPNSAYAFNGFDTKHLSNDDDEDDEDEDEWEDEDRPRRQRSIGKIEIDLKRRDTAKHQVFASNFYVAILIVVAVFGMLALAVYFGRRQFLPPGAIPKRKASPKSRSSRRSKPLRTPRGRQSIDEYFEVLGIPTNSTNDEIRARYRHLAKSLHTDKLANHDLPEEIVKLTEEQFMKVKAAYEAICAARKM